VTRLVGLTRGVSTRTVAGTLTLLIACMGFSGVIVFLARPASAHAVLVSSDPEDGARVDTEPTAVQLHFDEAVEIVPGAEKVISTTGIRVDIGDVRVIDGGTTIVLPLKPHLPDGTYSATWRVVSADTHVVDGSITFGIGVVPGAAAPRPRDHTTALAVTDDVAQGLVYGGIVLLVGVTAAGALLWPWAAGLRRTAVLAWSGWGLILVGTALQFLLQGPRAANGSWTAFADFRGAGQTLDATFGKQLIGRAALLITVVPLVVRRPRGVVGRTVGAYGGDRRTTATFRNGTLRTGLAALAGVAVLVSSAVTGHEAVGANVPLALLAAVLHLAAMSVWLGGLVVLAIAVLPALRRGDIDVHQARFTRWSATAYGCVVVLVVTGEYQASRQINPLQALWSTRYGAVLLIKVGLVCVMLAAAVAAHRRVTAATEHVSRTLTRSVGTEAAIAIAVLATTAILVSEPPARISYGPAVVLSAPLGTDRARIHIDTTRRGAQLIDVRILDAAGKPVPAQAVTATLTSAEVAALAVRLHALIPDGAEWQSAGTVVPLPGEWTLTLDVALASNKAYATSATYQVW
jgi:copper transport protein